jgi:Flp pilus assembly protein TadD
MREDFGKAFECCIKATSHNTYKSEIWYNLGVLYEKCRQPEEAKIAY